MPHTLYAVLNNGLKFSPQLASENKKFTGHGGETNRFRPCALWIPFNNSMSSPVRSTVLAFSSILLGVTDFGMAAIPRFTYDVLALHLVT